MDSSSPSPVASPVDGEEIIEGWAKEVICAYPWPCDEALAVAWCESRFIPDAISPDGDNWGLFQLNLVHLPRVWGQPEWFLDPATNTAIAFELWSERGWQPWACKP